MAHHEPPHLDLHDLPSSLWIVSMIQLGPDILWKFAEVNFVIFFFALKELKEWLAIVPTWKFPSSSARKLWQTVVKSANCLHLPWSTLTIRSILHSDQLKLCSECIWIIHVQNSAGHVAQLVGYLTRKSEVLGWVPGLATYFRFSFRWFKKGSCQLLAKVCAWSTG